MERDPVTTAPKKYEVIFTFERVMSGVPARYIVDEEQAKWVEEVLTSRPEQLAPSIEIIVEEQRHAHEPKKSKIIVRPALVGALIPL